METRLFFLFFFFSLFLSYSLGALAGGRRNPANPKANIFNVRKFGARGNGRTDDSKAFMKAWKVACASTGAVKLEIPTGTYFVGPLRFNGPCINVSSLTVQMQASSRSSHNFSPQYFKSGSYGLGRASHPARLIPQATLTATTDLSKFKSPHWVEFGWVDGLILTGGIFDGQGAVSWPFNKCPTQMDCKVLPTNILFVNTTNTVATGITSINSKFFHIGILSCTNFKGTNFKIRAPKNSPNTDGIHLERNSGVTLSHLTIGTGDDCVSIGQGNSDVTLRNIKCGPGHGISVGSLGRYKGEGDVTGLLVKNCTITGTTNGLRIKTWQNSPSPSIATNLTFDNIIMNNVDRPIVIDQEYCPYAKCDSSAPSRVKISGIKFKNIRGTSMNPEAVTLLCSQRMPCKDVSLQDVSLRYVGGGGGATAILNSTCQNVKPTFSGTQDPPPCQ
ncbi:Exopolygalacturonase [Dendrobium catenatum]|uniref:Exopolygalacturonase n=1 Tax=Dendrobium catenatum TaxID=906689 RepID=A0A2I0XFU0_9ASPA|nr:Exopolygalacturonase [Dendrobium catenatum]